MRITTGEYEVLDAGTVNSFNNEPITFHLAPTFKVTFSFETRRGVAGHRVDISLIDSGTAEFKLINLTDESEANSSEPLYMGMLEGKLLYLSFRAHKFKYSISRTITYTWYLKQPPVNEQGE